MRKIIYLVPLLFLNVACDKINALLNLPDTLSSMNTTMGSMNKTTSSMNQGMCTTNVGIHNQTLKLAMDGLTDKNNWDELIPVPFKMMPFGKAFAEEATSDELMLFFDSTIQELNQAKLDLSSDFSGNTTPYLQGSDALTAAIQEKVAKYEMLSIIAGFVPQSLTGAADVSVDANGCKVAKNNSTLNEIVAKQITGDNSETSGRYRTAALALLSLRASFLSGVILTNWTLAQPLSNIGIVEDAINYSERLDYVDKLPNADQITVVIKPQFHVVAKAGDPVSNQDLDLSTTVDTSQALTQWQAIQTGIDQDLKVGKAAVGQDPAAAAADQQAEAARVQAAKQTVTQYLSSWSTPAPTTPEN